VLAMMTINAARALNMAEHIGSLEVGKQADIAIVDARQPHLIPQILPVSRLVNHAAGQDVETVIVAGKVLMRDREVQTLARDHVIAEATAAFWDTAERAGIGEPNQLDPGIWHGVWHRMTAP
jgi:cytosine/adenosine deaminase-related metal-dependent hydrolase